MLKIKRIVNEVFNSNTYILYTDDEPSVYLIDPGNLKETLSWMEQNGKNDVKGILLTHSHFDHIYRVNDFLELYPHCILYVSSNHGKEYLADERKNFSRYHEHPITISYLHTFEIQDNGEFLLWDQIVVICLHTPGHSPDSVCYLIGKSFFTGDTLIKNARTVTKLKGGSIDDFKETIHRLEMMKKNGLSVFPGHNEIFNLDTYNIEKSILNNKLKQ